MAVVHCHDPPLGFQRTRRLFVVYDELLSCPAANRTTPSQRRVLQIYGHAVCLHRPRLSGLPVSTVSQRWLPSSVVPVGILSCLLLEYVHQLVDSFASYSVSDPFFPSLSFLSTTPSTPLNARPRYIHTAPLQMVGLDHAERRQGDSLPLGRSVRPALGMDRMWPAVPGPLL